MARRGKRPPQVAVEARIESLSPDGRGVAHLDGKTVFIHGALPGERVLFKLTAMHHRYDEGVAEEVLEASPERVAPRCAHYELCGGCSLQHLEASAQIRHKQQGLLDNLRHIGGVEPERLLEPLTGPAWGYRRRARLGVKLVHKKGRVLVGFRERRSNFLAELERCEVLDPKVGARLGELARLIEGLEAREGIPQIEVALGDALTVLVFRHLQPLSARDRELLAEYGRAHDLAIALQPGGPESLEPLWPERQPLYYAHPQFDTRVDFAPLDFVQVNGELNRRMVALALELLAVEPEHSVLDLFCGLGNFTLPLARRAREVIGVEGEQRMVERARANARANGIENTQYHAADLAGDLAGVPWLARRYDRILLDPPRTGAKQVIDHLGRLKAERIVYVSCHPATLARDAGELVRTHRYRLAAAGVMDMFPHTAHVESIALFERR